ncbi:hypothetical protein HFC70_24620 [Agrobacterium sp. a22-2]|uniref:hypothetical protein n=1 Tax=Agrobacterium sp. a22-2 TaxID=2283840 RepID=UPI001444D8AE|nr:hypothetical protein [Agrobacterium sp. a22-2]NKN39535.1 hypothetical protein [Agrobacterium sp. a22-2]
MAEIVKIKDRLERRLAPKPTPGRQAKILLFTGVRYLRDEMPSLGHPAMPATSGHLMRHDPHPFEG